MAVHKFDGKKRGCGYPQVGGIYLVSAALSTPCDRLPHEIPACPVCGETIRFSRSMQKISPYELFGDHKHCKDKVLPCPMCQPSPLDAGLMWVGKAYYTPESFVKEAFTLGVSKRIHRLPDFFKVGKSWLYLAHQKACRGPLAAGPRVLDEQGVILPGIVCVTRPIRIEKVMKESDITPEKVKELEGRGIDVLAVPDDERFTTPYRPSRKQAHPLRRLLGSQSEA